MNGFKRGSGCYKCTCCGRQTRATGRGDNEHVKACVECYDIAGLENQLMDGNYNNETERLSIIDEISHLARIIKEKGGNAYSDYL